MSDTRNYVQSVDFSLAGSGVTLSATSATLVSFNYPNGDAIAFADFGTLGYITFEPETTREENASFTGLTTNANGTVTLTGLTRGLKFKTPYDQDTALRQAHAGGTTVRVTNSAPFYSNFANKENDETITQLWTFPNNGNTPVLGTVYAAPTTDLQMASKKYVDDVAIAGAPDASNVTKGITKLSVAAASPTDPIAVGDNDGRVPTQGENNALVGNNGTPSTTNTYVTQTGFQRAQEIFAASATGNDTYVVTLSPVPAAYVNGMVINFKTDVANTGAATLNVNGLGAIAINKANDQALDTGDIEANQIVSVVYNSTGPKFQMQSQLASGNDFILKSTLAAKGDLISASAASTPLALTVGANGTELVADSTQATGLRWRSPVNSFVSDPVADTSAVTANTDHAYVTTFTPKAITIHYKIFGTNGATGKYSLGIASWDGTTIKSNFIFRDSVNAGTTLTVDAPTITAAAPEVGTTGAGDIRIRILVTAVSATGFTVRSEFTAGAGAPGASADYYVVATQ